MLRKISEIMGLTLAARDGHIGHVKDFYFDDQRWTIRYLVADTGHWLASRKVLLAPRAVLVIRDDHRRMEMDLTKDQIENSPSIDHEKPVSRQFQEKFSSYYNYPYYWGPAWGMDPFPMVYPMFPDPPENIAQSQSIEDTGHDPHLRSTKEVTRYYIHARDGNIGHVEDFVLNDQTWSIEYMVVDTMNWWPGKKVLVSPAWASRIDWQESTVHLILDRDTIKAAPEYQASQPITREYETRLFKHYDQRPKWSERKEV